MFAAKLPGPRRRRRPAADDAAVRSPPWPPPLARGPPPPGSSRSKLVRGMMRVRAPAESQQPHVCVGERGRMGKRRAALTHARTHATPRHRKIRHVSMHQAGWMRTEPRLARENLRTGLCALLDAHKTGNTRDASLRPLPSTIKVAANFLFPCDASSLAKFGHHQTL